MTTAKPIPPMTAADTARFNAKVAHVGEGDCWPWQGAIRGDGYGAFHLHGSLFIAHRIAVRVAGYSVPTKAVIDHICRNRLCVNPAHLRTVDRFTNVHENSEALAHLNSVKTHCPKGHPYSGGNLVIRRSGVRRCRECENAYQRALRAKRRDSLSDAVLTEGKDAPQ